jgi:aminoglycoside phosphotransferase (APT) family kinase protein
VFALHTDGAAPPLVVKLFDPDAAWQLAQESFVYERLRPAGVPVPDVLATDASRKRVGTDWMLMRRLPGATVASLAPSAREAREIYQQIGATLRAVHAVRLARFGFFDRRGPVDGLATNREFVRVWFERDLRGFAERGGPASLAARVERRVAAAAALVDACSGPVLCHTDLHEANLLVERGPEGWRVTGVLDAGGAIAADPLFDVARTDYWSARGDAEKRAGLREGYGARFGTDEEARIALYALHHALELWAWFARARDARRAAEIAADLDRLAAPA